MTPSRAVSAAAICSEVLSNSAFTFVTDSEADGKGYSSVRVYMIFEMVDQVRMVKQANLAVYDIY
jgi:hypothetical protein